ncbi:MAG: oxidoreductase [Cyanobacteria bacterium QS_6_48_18]|nr:MAG: oxidoreductase [Cyanobacteria bacterium QS_6_48_18]
MEEMQFKIPPKTRVLVTGATGFTGSVLVKKLVEMNLDVVAIARPTSNIEPFNEMPIEWIRGDVFDEKVVEKAVKGVSYIFHLATPFREAKSPDSGHHDVHVLSTQILAKAALKETSFKRFVHVSTVGFHGHIENPPADENYPMNPGDIYQKTKVDAELWLRDFAEKENLPIAVVRPAAIYGPGDKRLLKVYKMVCRKWVLLVGNKNHLYHLIHVDDLTDFFIVAASHPQAVGEVFICGNKEAITYKDMVSIIGKHYGVNVKFIKIPYKLLFKLGHLFEVIFRPLGIEPPIYRRRIDFFTKDRSFNTEKMRNVLGFLPAYSDEEGLKQTAQWYLEQGWVSLKK